MRDRDRLYPASDEDRPRFCARRTRGVQQDDPPDDCGSDFGFTTCAVVCVMFFLLLVVFGSVSYARYGREGHGDWDDRRAWWCARCDSPSCASACWGSRY